MFLIMLLEFSMKKNHKKFINLIYISISIILSLFIIKISNNFEFWTNFFKLFGISSLWPSFGDFRSHQTLPLTVDQNINPYFEHPNDPWNRTINYPFVWYYISKNFNLLNEHIFLIIMFSLVSLYTFSVFKLMDLINSKLIVKLIIPIFFLSSSSMLTIERGNTDIILFISIFFICYINNLNISFLLYLFSSIIKIYPLIIGYIFVDNIRNLILILFILIVVFLFNLEYLHFYLSNTSSTYDSGFVYGVKSLLNGYPKALDRMGINISKNFIIDSFIYIAILSSVLYSFLYGFKKEKVISEKKKLDLNEKLFLTSSTIYIGTFIILSNYDYRLIFLIMTMPFICRNNLKLIDLIFIFCFLISINSILIFGFVKNPIGYLYVGTSIHLCKIYMLIYLSYNISKILKRNINFFSFKFLKFLT
tara:strand:- start:22522 stop:23781 length:1260 start_codon:yes stop_codon:yes gene_type:complete